MALVVPAFVVQDNDLALSPNPQSDIFATHFDVLASALQWINVANGLSVTQRGAGANMSVDVAAGKAFTAGYRAFGSTTNVAITAADPTNPRVDVIVVNNAGSIVSRTGTAAANPKPARLTSGDCALAFVYVPANAGSIVNADITDARFLGVPTLTTYTPTPVPGSGSFTSASAAGRYWVYGTICFWQCAVTITTNGTAAGNVLIPTPANISAVVNAPVFGRATAVSGKSLNGVISGTTVQIWNYDNTYPGASGEILNVAAVFEIS